MNLRTRLERLEQRTGEQNPLTRGTHAHHIRITLGGSESTGQVNEWVEDTTTGARIDITDEWRRWIVEYESQHPERRPTRVLMCTDYDATELTQYEIITANGNDPNS